MNPAPAFSTPLPRDPAKKLVLFHRDFQRFTGGHLKIWNYFQHVRASPAHEPRVAFSAESKWDPTNPWFGSPESIAEWDPEKADILFLAGTDWRAFPKSGRFSRPIINLIQHPRHAEKKSELRGFLKNRAVRICVSQEVAAAINATGEANGPVLVIPNGIDLQSLPRSKPSVERATDVLICGLKAPELAREVYTGLVHPRRLVRWLIDWVPRKEYLARVADAKITVFLPRAAEGFYLPALEGMACGTVVVCPDCEGNRGFCLGGANCFRPAYDASAIISAATSALEQTESQRTNMLAEAQTTVREHSLEGERTSFLKVLGRIDELWKT
jgi:glycosyltransferase involved in cell wall biosynthesis